MPLARFPMMNKKSFCTIITITLLISQSALHAETPAEIVAETIANEIVPLVERMLGGDVEVNATEPESVNDRGHMYLVSGSIKARRDRKVVFKQDYVIEVFKVGERFQLDDIMLNNKIIREGIIEPFDYFQKIKASPRMWVSQNGTFSTKAAFVTRTKDTVTLKRVDSGKEITVDISRLSSGCSDWVKDFASGRPVMSDQAKIDKILRAEKEVKTLLKNLVEEERVFKKEVQDLKAMGKDLGMRTGNEYARELSEYKQEIREIREQLKASAGKRKKILSRYK